MDVDPAPESPKGSPVKVDKVAVATKHPGVFMTTQEVEKETGKTGLPRGIPLGKREDSSQGTEEPVDEEEQQQEPPDETGDGKSSKPAPKETLSSNALAAGEIEMAAGEVKVEDATPAPSVATRRSNRRAKQEEVEVKPSSPLPLPAGDVSEEADSECSEARDDEESVDSGGSVTTRSSGRRKGEGAEAKAASSKKTRNGKASRARGEGKGQTAKGKGRRVIFKKSVS